MLLPAPNIEICRYEYPFTLSLSKGAGSVVRQAHHERVL